MWILPNRASRIGLAIVDEQTCLPYAGSADCQLCVDECRAAGYHAIEFLRIGTQADPFGQPIPDTGRLAPVVAADRCVGCGLCQTRCYAINVKHKGLLTESAVWIVAGDDREDRIASGSYREFARQRRERRPTDRRETSPEGGDYLPDAMR